MAGTQQALTKAAVEHAMPSKFGTMLWDGRVPGFGVRVYPSKREFIYRYRLPNRKQRVVRLGRFGPLTVEKARGMALDLYEAIRKGRDPVAEKEAQQAIEQAQQEAEGNRRSVSDVLDQFMLRYVRANQLRSNREYQSAFDRLVKPAIGDTDIHGLKRSQIAEMLDRIEDENGPVMADRTLAYLRKALNWYAARDDEFNNPIAKGMARTKPKDRARSRVLSDDELRVVWRVADADGAFGAFVKALLLLAQRRGEVAHMRRSEIAADGTWTIPAERYKTKRPNVVPLSADAKALVDQQPVREDGFVFPPSFDTHGKPKAKLDATITQANGGEPLPAWTLHDLRRTAKTLMARASVSPHVSERVLGHVIAGVEGVYDQHDYLPEKRKALEALTRKIASIVDPATSNVVELAAAR